MYSSNFLFNVHNYLLYNRFIKIIVYLKTFQNSYSFLYIKCLMQNISIYQGYENKLNILRYVLHFYFFLKFCRKLILILIENINGCMFVICCRYVLKLFLITFSWCSKKLLCIPSFKK